MKKILSIGSSIVLVFFLGGCIKEADKVADFTFINSSQSQLKINFNSAYTANPSFQVKVNDVRVSGLIATRTPFPGGGYNTNGDSRPDYLAVTPGSAKISFAIPAKNTTTDSVLLYTTTVSLSADKHYTAHITDTAANTKILLLEDDISFPAAGTSRYKFVHLMPNVTAIDLYHGTVLVASNVPYLGTVTFIRNTPGAASDWTVRETGTGSAGVVLATYSSTNTVISQRGYTVFATGYKTIADAVRKPYVSFLLNE